MVEYAALTASARRSEAKIFFADEAHFRADGDLRGKWVLKGEPALVDSTSPTPGREGQLLLGMWQTWRPKARWQMMDTGGQQQLRHLSRLPAATEGATHRTTDRDLGQFARPIVATRYEPDLMHTPGLNLCYGQPSPVDSRRLQCSMRPS